MPNLGLPYQNINVFIYNKLSNFKGLIQKGGVGSNQEKNSCLCTFYMKIWTVKDYNVVGVGKGRP